MERSGSGKNHPCGKNSSTWGKRLAIPSNSTFLWRVEVSQNSDRSIGAADDEKGSIDETSKLCKPESGFRTK
jgi:hypothetical protein